MNSELHELLSDKNTIVGEDLNDPYGGAFKVTKGLSSKFLTKYSPHQFQSSLLVL